MYLHSIGSLSNTLTKSTSKAKGPEISIAIPPMAACLCYVTLREADSCRRAALCQESVNASFRRKPHARSSYLKHLSNHLETLPKGPVQVASMAMLRTSTSLPICLLWTVE